MKIPKLANEEARQREIDRTLSQMCSWNEDAETFLKRGDYHCAELAITHVHNLGRKLAILRTPTLFDL